MFPKLNVNLSNRELTSIDIIVRISKLYKRAGVLRSKIPLCHHKKSKQIVDAWLRKYKEQDNVKNSFLAGIDCDESFKYISRINRKRIIKLQSYGNQIGCLTKLLKFFLGSKNK